MPDDPEVLQAERSATSGSAPQISLEGPIDPNTYICGPGDVFELNFWGQQNFRLRIAADLEARVFISKVGFVDVANQTLTAARTLVGKKVRAVYPGLRFELALLAPRTFQVHVVDNVKQPGSYTAKPFERVATVLARAGGITGSRRRISIQRRDGKLLDADLLLYELTGDTTHNPLLLDGDVVRVRLPGLEAEISGAVRRPGRYELTTTKDLAELLELAGGFTSAVAKALPLRVIRRNDQEHQKFIDVPLEGTTPRATALVDDDLVIVRGAEEFQRSVLLIGAVAGADQIDAAASSKRLPFVEGDTVLSLLTRAGGVKAAGDLRRAYISRPRADSSVELVSVNLERLLVARDLAADRTIAMGDTIVIPPFQYSVLVEGAVTRAGIYNYNPLFSIPEYIARAGGRSRTAKELDDVVLIDSNGKTHDFKAGLKPSPGDAILVPERNFSRAEAVQLVVGIAGLVLSGVAITIAATR